MICFESNLMPKCQLFIKTAQKCNSSKQPGAKMTIFLQSCSNMHLFEAAWRQNDNFWLKLIKNIPFWSILARQCHFLGQDFGQTEQQKQQLSMQQQKHSLQQQRGACEARAPLLFPSPLLFLLFSLTKILTNNLTKHLTEKLHFFAWLFQKKNFW